MTRTAIGGIAAGAFTLGILAGLVVPGSLGPTRHDQLMTSHMSAGRSMPMMDMGSMPMGEQSGPAWHATHHASHEARR